MVFGKSRFRTESCLSLIMGKIVDRLVMILGQINSVSFVFETLRNKESKFSLRRCRVRTCLRWWAVVITQSTCRDSFILRHHWPITVQGILSHLPIPTHVRASCTTSDTIYAPTLGKSRFGPVISTIYSYCKYFFYLRADYNDASSGFGLWVKHASSFRLDLCVVAVLMKFCEVPFLLLSTSI